MEEQHEQENSFSDEEIEEVEASIVSGDESKIGVTEEEFAHFIGKKADKYLWKFKKFNVNGVDKFVLTWNWSAFFFLYVWMAFRKMYLWAAFCLLLYCVGFSLLFPLIHPALTEFYLILLFLSAFIIRIALMTAFGIAGNYLYYKRAKQKITKWKGGDMTKPLAKVGGLSLVAGGLPVGVLLPIEILLFAALASQIVIP
jgi:hypothetical protein